MEKKKSISEFISDLGLNDLQKDFLNKFSKLRTAKKFEIEALRLIGRPELVKDWCYNGYKDTGSMGQGRCSRGHALRYEHYAKNIITEEVIVFGIKCVTDFFNLTPQQLKLIKQGVAETNQEIYQILEKLTKYKTFKQYEKENMIEHKLNLISKQPQHLLTIVDFLNHQLPLPDILENEINKIWRSESSDRDFIEFFKDFPELRELTIKAQVIDDNSKFKERHLSIWKKIHDITSYLHKYKNISSGQMGLFKKLLNVDYDLIDGLISDLRLVNKTHYIQNSKFNELDLLKSFMTQYEEWGLTENQINLVKKIHKRLSKHIETAKNFQLNSSIAE
jgi:hypothetical protein